MAWSEVQNQRFNLFKSGRWRSHYYGAEVFWGTLCGIKNAFCVHQSKVNHYQELYPRSIYK